MPARHLATVTTQSIARDLDMPLAWSSPARVLIGPLSIYGVDVDGVGEGVAYQIILPSNVKAITKLEFIYVSNIADADGMSADVYVIATSMANGNPAADQQTVSALDTTLVAVLNNLRRHDLTGLFNTIEPLWRRVVGGDMLTVIVLYHAISGAKSATDLQALSAVVTYSF